MEKTINLNKVRNGAKQRFQDGGFYCSEALLTPIRDRLAPEMPEALIAAASGFPVGVGHSKGMCGNGVVKRNT